MKTQTLNKFYSPTLPRTLLLGVLVVGNLYFLFADRDLPHSTQEGYSRTPAIAPTVPLKVRTANSSKDSSTRPGKLEKGPEFVAVPVAIFESMGLGGVNFFLDDNTCELTPDAARALNLNEAETKFVSENLRSAALRQAAIEKGHAKVQQQGDNTWLITIDPAAHDQIKNEQQRLVDTLSQTLPADALRIVMQNLQIQLHTTAEGANRQYSVTQAGSFFKIQSAALRMNAGLSSSLLKTSTSLSWIGDLVNGK